MEVQSRSPTICPKTQPYTVTRRSSLDNPDLPSFTVWSGVPSWNLKKVIWITGDHTITQVKQAFNKTAKSIQLNPEDLNVNIKWVTMDTGTTSMVMDKIIDTYMKIASRNLEPQYQNHGLPNHLLLHAGFHNLGRQQIHQVNNRILKDIETLSFLLPRP